MSSRILVALRVPGPASRAFKIFTEQTALWWRPNAVFNFTPRDSGEVAFEPPIHETPGRFIERLSDGETFVIGEIDVWDPPHRLVFGWRQASFAPDQHTQVEITFAQVGEQTRVTVQHWGWDSVPQTHVARHRFPPTIFAQRHAEWWGALLASFQRIVS